MRPGLTHRYNRMGDQKGPDMTFVIAVTIGVVLWAALTIWLDGIWATRRQLWLVQLAGRGVADEAWEWLNSR